MAAREFHGILVNQWDTPLISAGDEVDRGDWQDPWYPSKVPGPGRIEPGHEAEWRSESGGVMTGTSGWARWSVHVDDVNDDHFETIQINWYVPFDLLGGVPDITSGVFRGSLNNSDPFQPRDPRQPLLEVIPVKAGDLGPDASYTLVPYFFTVPVSWFLDKAIFGGVNRPKVRFIVRQRTNVQQSRLTFPAMFPSREQTAMAAFRQRMSLAPAAGFVGGFPTFYESTDHNNHLGGAVFVKSTTAELRDIPLADLGSVALDDFEGRMRATNAYARQLPAVPSRVPAGRVQSTIASHASIAHYPFIGGFPTFYHADYGKGPVCGTVLVRSDGAELRDIEVSALGNPPLNNFEALFRATQDYAYRNNFVGGFPTLEHHTATTIDPRTGSRQHEVVCSAVLFKKGGIDVRTQQHQATYAEHRDVVLWQDPG